MDIGPGYSFLGGVYGREREWDGIEQVMEKCKQGIALHFKERAGLCCWLY
jgi:hypothetical protein